MLLASFDGAKLISRKQPGLKPLILQRRWTLISRSGTIGNVVYSRKDMDGLAGSEHILRVVPDERRIAPGYLYAFLSGAMGKALLRSGTFGSIVDTIEPDFVGGLPVPRFSTATETHIADLIEESSRLREQANSDLARLLGRINAEVLGIPSKYKSRWPDEWSFAVDAVLLRGLTRLDAFYHAGHSVEYREHTGSGPSLGDIATVQLPGKFKRNYVNRDGVPYLSGVDVYQLRVEPRLWLSKRQVELPELLISQPGLILVQADGQRYGLLGRPAWADEFMVGSAASNHLARIRVTDPGLRGYVFLFLSTEAGRRALIRESYGTSIPTIPRSAFARLRIPGADSELARRLGKETLDVLDLRSQARRIEDEAQEVLAGALKA